jgi:TolB-like protein
MRNLLLLATILQLSACASTGNKNTGIVSLDRAIQNAGQEITDTLASNTKVVMLNFSSPSDQFSDYVIEELSLALVKSKKLVIVDRKNLDLIREEMNFQMSGEVDDESAQEIGKLLGAESIISGSLLNMGDFYRFRVKTINVSSAAIEVSFSISVENDNQTQFLLAGGGSAPRVLSVSAGNAQAPQPQIVPAQLETQAAPPAPAADPGMVYTVGDIGPAGGYIFYDKGRFSNGWRYLEAGPPETEKNLEWSGRHTSVDDTQSTIGSGRRNTQLIVEKFAQVAGEWDRAAQYCAELDVNGFNDWFLPSIDELNQMYGNLKRKNLGNFKEEWYWSSTVQWTQGFTDGELYNGAPPNQKRHVRPVRAF